jgi:hypothetical protein
MKGAFAVVRLAALTCIRSGVLVASVALLAQSVPTQSYAATADQQGGIRMMLKVQIPPEGGNQAIKAGNQGAIFEALIDQIKPEAVYFTQEDGLRTVYFVYKIQKTTDFAAIHEPLIQGFGARVYDMPALTWDELKKAFEAIDEKP